MLRPQLIGAPRLRLHPRRHLGLSGSVRPVAESVRGVRCVQPVGHRAQPPHGLHLGRPELRPRREAEAQAAVEHASAHLPPQHVDARLAVRRLPRIRLGLVTLLELGNLGIVGRGAQTGLGELLLALGLDAADLLLEALLQQLAGHLLFGRPPLLPRMPPLALLAQ